MITQEQYDRLCATTKAYGVNLRLEDVADLLEAFEQLHAELNNALDHGYISDQRGFDLLWDDEGNEIVTLKKGNR